MTKQDLIDYIYTPEGKARAPRFKRELLEKNGFTSLILTIESECESVGLGDVPLTDKIRAYCKNQMFNPLCKTCQQPYRLWSNKHQAWAKYCSQACVQNDPEVKAKNFCDDYDALVKKREKTMMEKYGVISYSQTEAHKEAFVERTKEAWADTERREKRLATRKETNQAKYGVSAVSSVPEIMAKAVATWKERREKMSEEEWREYEKARIDAYRKERLSEDVYRKLSDYDLLYDLAVTKNLPISKCAERIGCSVCAVKTALGEFGIEYVPKMNTLESSDEIELYEFVVTVKPTAIRTYKIGKHLDIFIPELNLGFEYNGVYWHSDARCEKEYHSNKVEHFYSHGIRYVQIWEDDWLQRKDTVKNFIRNLLTDNHVTYKHEVVNITQEDFDSYTEDNHISGTAKSDVCFGVLSDGEIVAVLGINDNGDGKFEITRHSEMDKNLFGVMFDWFVSSFDPRSVRVVGDLEYTDKRDNAYLRNGFVQHRDIEPDFKYYDYRTGMRESKESIDMNVVNEEGKLHRLLRCYDSGKIEYIWRKT